MTRSYGGRLKKQIASPLNPCFKPNTKMQDAEAAISDAINRLSGRWRAANLHPLLVFRVSQKLILAP